MRRQLLFFSRLSDNTFKSLMWFWTSTGNYKQEDNYEPKETEKYNTGGKESLGMRVWHNESRITISFMQICSTGHCWKFPGIKQWKVWNEGAASAWQAINGQVVLLEGTDLWCPSKSMKRKSPKYFIKLIKIMITDQHKNPDEKNNFDAKRKVKNIELFALSAWASQLLVSISQVFCCISSS